MTPEAQRIGIAKACGWKLAYYSSIADGRPVYYTPKSTAKTSVLPGYLSDLNAMHEAEKVLTPIQRHDYHLYLCKSGGCSPTTDLETNFHTAITATAAQRAEAFLRTLNLWDDNK